MAKRLGREDVSGVVALLTSAMSLVRQTLQAMKLAEIQRKVWFCLTKPVKAFLAMGFNGF